jgi:hypothetical protein
MDSSTLNIWLKQIEWNDSSLEIDKLLRYNQTPNFNVEQLADQSLKDSLKQFDPLNSEEIKQLVALMMIKSSEVGLVFVYLGSEKLKHCIPELLVYLQDMNWPAAVYVAHVLRQMPHELLVPELTRIFKDDYEDDIWIYWICSALIDGMDKRFLEALKNPILNYIKNSLCPEEPIRAAETIIPVLTLEEFQDICIYHETKFASYYPLDEMAEFKESFINSRRKDV